ncbi:MAG: hypothetical protein EOP35_17505 [Rubrivivax sp.]|nr:MAG: hypothetical protein EOP35_17505 [Rubrivivax sp.]
MADAPHRRRREDGVMHIIQHGLPQPSEEPGVQRVHLAGPGRGFQGLDCWLLTIAPQAFTEGRADKDGEHALVVLAGLGKLLLAGAPQRFAAPCTLQLPPAVDYRIVSQGVEPLQLLSIRTVGTPGTGT